MTREEARNLARKMGADKPQSLKEQMAHNIDRSSGGMGWSQSRAAQERIEALADDILAGRVRVP